MDKLIVWMERAGGFSLFVIMLLIAASAATRYLFNWPLPDSDGLGRLLLGVVVFWGLAGACKYDEHIRIDLVWERMSARARVWTNRFAMVFTLAAIGTLTGTAFVKVVEIMRSNETTYDLRLPVWPFYGLAWLGLVATVAVLLWLLTRERRGGVG